MKINQFTEVGYCSSIDKLLQVLLFNHLQCANMYMYLYWYKCVKKRYSQYLSVWSITMILMELKWVFLSSIHTLIHITDITIKLLKVWIYCFLYKLYQLTFHFVIFYISRHSTKFISIRNNAHSYMNLF